VVFDLQGYRVEIRADGEHVVYEPENRGKSRTSAVQSVWPLAQRQFSIAERSDCVCEKIIEE